MSLEKLPDVNSIDKATIKYNVLIMALTVSDSLVEVPIFQYRGQNNTLTAPGLGLIIRP